MKVRSGFVSNSSSSSFIIVGYKITKKVYEELQEEDVWSVCDMESPNDYYDGDEESCIVGKQVKDCDFIDGGFVKLDFDEIDQLKNNMKEILKDVKNETVKHLVETQVPQVYIGATSG